MFKFLSVALVSLIFAPVAFGQMKPADAQAKLAERQAKEATAATQPSGVSKGEFNQMRREIDDLSAQNIKLQATVAALEQQLAAYKQADQSPGASPNFWGETEARVGMTMADLKRLPNVDLNLISENTTASVYRVCTGHVDDYGDRTVDDLPSSVSGPQSHTERVVIGSHAAKIQRVVIDAASGKVVHVELDTDQ